MQDIREEAKLICAQIKIDPDSLVLRDLKSFQEDGILEKIQQVRFKHYNQRRMKHL